MRLESTKEQKKLAKILQEEQYSVLTMRLLSIIDDLHVKAEAMSIF